MVTVARVVGEVVVGVEIVVEAHKAHHVLACSEPLSYAVSVSVLYCHDNGDFTIYIKVDP